jgi:hypothetical protein
MARDSTGDNVLSRDLDAELRVEVVHYGVGERVLEVEDARVVFNWL